MCLYETIGINTKYIPNQKNKGVIPLMRDKRLKNVPRQCGKCMHCVKKKARDMKQRLLEDIRVNKNALFVTFTFSDEALVKLEDELKYVKGYDLDNEVMKLAINRMSLRIKAKTGNRMRRFVVSEIGGTRTQRIHAHAIVWNVDAETIKEQWAMYGHTYIGEYVNSQTIGYIVKYIYKTDIKHKEYRPKIIASRGIGKDFIYSASAALIREQNGNDGPMYVHRNGIKEPLNRQFKQWIFTEDEIEEQTIKQLDKEEMYIGTYKIKKTDEKNINAVLQMEKQKAKRRGYQEQKINFESRGQ